jgi:hypothetical protein
MYETTSVKPGAHRAPRQDGYEYIWLCLRKNDASPRGRELLLPVALGTE